MAQSFRGSQLCAVLLLLLVIPTMPVPRMCFLPVCWFVSLMVILMSFSLHNSCSSRLIDWYQNGVLFSFSFITIFINNCCSIFTTITNPTLSFFTIFNCHLKFLICKLEYCTLFGRISKAHATTRWGVFQYVLLPPFIFSWQAGSITLSWMGTRITYLYHLLRKSSPARWKG